MPKIIPILMIVLISGHFLIGCSTFLAVEKQSQASVMTSEVQETQPGLFLEKAEGQLKKRVDFWIDIYTRYSTQQGLVHDAKYVDHIYEVLDFRELKRAGKRASKGSLIQLSKRKWKNVLLSIHHKQSHPSTMNDEEKKIFRLFQDIDEPNKFLNAAHRKRLRFQLGQRDQFLEGLRLSGLFLKEMEEVFRKEGMPVELTRLPFVESSFNIHALSKVGASGIWQFMGSTASLFIRIDDSVDERNDPLRATFAAARLLKMNYDSLQNWGLAVTAYNHGRKNLMRAVRKLAAENLQDVILDNRNRSFGFASGNFFAELLASIEVEKNAKKYFGVVARELPIEYFKVEFSEDLKIHDLNQLVKCEFKVFKDLNMALTDAVYSGQLSIPTHYELKIPIPKGLSQKQASQDFWKSYQQWIARRK